MFEGWVYQLVAGYLGNYIKDIHREQFRVGLWSGVALLENAELRLEAFDYLQLPFAIKEGFVGKLRLQVPWKTLLWEPILITLEDVFVCAYPREESEFDAEASESRELAAKKANLTAAEITKLGSHVSDDKVRYSLLSQLLAKFIANIQVSIHNVHIRYVDNRGEGGFNFGAKLAGLVVSTMDGKGAGVPVAAKNKSSLVHKSVEISKFAVYWNSTSVPRPVHNTVRHYLTKWFAQNDDNTYILNPVDIFSKLTVNKSAASEGIGAQYALNTNVEKLDLNLGNRQVFEMFLLLDSLNVSKLRERYGRFRPRIGPSATRDWQRVWWQYAIKSVSSDVQRRLRRSSWRYLSWRLNCRRRYVLLYKEKLEYFREGKPPPGEVLNGLESLERELDMDMIISFRSLAEERCQSERGFGAPEVENKKVVPEDVRSSHSRGWLNLFSFGMLGASGTMDTAAEFTGPLSDEIMKDLYEVTNFHPAHVPNGEWKGYCLIAINLQLRQTVARLEDSETKEGIVEVTFLEIYASFKKLQHLANAAIMVKSLEAKDVCPDDSCFRNILSSKGMKSRYAGIKHKSYAEAVYGSLFQIGVSQREIAEAAFCVDIEISEDLKILVVLKPLEIVYSSPVIRGLLSFFKLPRLHAIDLEIKALDKLEKFHSPRARMNLKLTVDVRNPVLLIPERPTTSDCAILVVLLDSIRLETSEGLFKDEGKKDELQKKLKAKFTCLDFPIHVSVLQHLEINTVGLQVGLGRGSKDSNLVSPCWATLVDRFDVQTNILKYESLLTMHWKVEGSSGAIAAYVTAADCKLLNVIFHATIAPFDSREEISLGELPKLRTSSSLISGHLAVASVNLQLSVEGGPLNLHLEQLDFKTSAASLQLEVALSARKFFVGLVDLPEDHLHRVLLKESGSGVSAFSMTYLKTWKDSKFFMQLRKAECTIYPKTFAALVAFLETAFEVSSPPGVFEAAGNRLVQKSCTIDFGDVSIVLLEDYGAVACLELPKATFLLSSSDNTFSIWDLEGNARDLRITGPDFAVLGIDRVPFGTLSGGPGSKLNLRLAKDETSLKIVVTLARVECVLRADYLAILIGFFRSPGWSWSSKEQVRKDEVVEYKVGVRKSLLLLPTGGGGYAKIVIPEFEFSFVPAGIVRDFQDAFPGYETCTANRAFYVMGKQLSLSTCGLNPEAGSGEKATFCLPFIERLDGEVLIEVPSAPASTSIVLKFPVVRLMFTGDIFLRQIKWIEILSADLTTVGRKASHANRIWESLSGGQYVVIDKGDDQPAGPYLDVSCRIDDICFSVNGFSKQSIWIAETILAVQATTATLFCKVRAGDIEDVGIKMTAVKFLDGGRNSFAFDRQPSRTQLFTNDSLIPIEGRTMMAAGACDVSAISAKVASRRVEVCLPNAEIWLHFGSWSRLISWIFLCFPMPSLTDETSGDTDTLCPSQLIEVRDHWTVRADAPRLAIFIPDSGNSGTTSRESIKTICFTTEFYIDELNFAETLCNFRAHLSHLRGEMIEGRTSSYCCLLGGDIRIEGNLRLDLPVVITSIIIVKSIDGWCSYPVLQFLNNFKLEAPIEDDDTAMLDVEFSLKADIATASLLLTDGRWNYNCPLLEIILGNASVELGVRAGSLQSMLCTSFEISYHNIQKAVWEPFLEPWSISAEVSKEYGDLHTKVEVVSPSNLNINITEGFTQAASRAWEMISWTTESFQDVKRGLRDQKHFSQYAPYWLQNDSGMAVSYCLILPSWTEESSDISTLDTSATWSKLPPGCSVPLFVDQNEGFIQHRRARWNTSGVLEKKKFGIISHRRMCLRLEGTAAPSLPMSIDLVGTRAFEVAFSKVEVVNNARHALQVDKLDEHRNYAFTTHALFEVSLQHHSKLIRLRSTVALANMTSLMWEARLEIPFGIAPKIMDPILPDEIIPLPVHLAEAARVRLRPYGKDFLWSEPHSLSKLLSNHSFQRPVLCYPPRPNDAPFRCCINVVEEKIFPADVLKAKSQEHPSRWKTWSVILRAPFVIRNCLPCPLDVEIENVAGLNVYASVPKGDSTSIYEVDIVSDLNLKLIIRDFLPSTLKLGRPTSRDKPETGETEETLIFFSESPTGLPLCARVEKTTDIISGRREISISAPYWIFNCSGLDLRFMDGNVDLHLGKEQVLPDAYNKGASRSHDYRGLKELLRTCFSGERQPGKIASHLPSFRVFKPVEATEATNQTNGDSKDGVPLLPSARLYSPAQGLQVSDHKMRLNILCSLHSPWGQPFLLDPPGGTAPILIPQPDSKGAYMLSISSVPACSGRTKIITFRPRFVLANACRQDICFKQQGTDIVQHLPSGENVHVHWTDASRALLLSVRYNEHGWDWSGGFSLDRLGDTQVKVHSHFTSSKEILRVEVSDPDAGDLRTGNKSVGTFLIIVTNDETGFMPYRIDNFTTARLRFYQKKCERTENILQPYSSCDYAWDEPSLPPRLVIEVLGHGTLGAYELETVKLYPPVQLHASGQKIERRLVVSVEAEGARRVLSVVDSNLHTEKDPKASALRNSMQSALESFTLNLSSAGVSLVDALPQEIAFASASAVKFQLLQNDRQQEVTLEIKGLQVDNDLRHATYPVMLSTVTVSSNWGTSERKGEHQITEKPAVMLAVSKWRHRTGSVDCYQGIYLSISPLRLEVEERNLLCLIGFFKNLTVGGSNMGTEKSTSFKVLSNADGDLRNLRFVEVAEALDVYKSWPFPPEPARLPPTRLYVSAKKPKAYIETFCIEPIELTISFSSNAWLPKATRGAAAQSILWVTGSLLQRRLIALADVEGAPVRLRQLTLAHPMASWSAIMEIIQRHYTRQLLHEVYKVLGSADVFGNPMSFMRSLGSGMWDFVSAPARSIRQNPVYVVQGVRLGTKSLFRNTIFAFSNAATQMSKAARKGVAALALDQDHITEHDIQQYGRDSSIVNEFLEGLTGLLQSSVRGAERHGIPGAFSGMALGMLRAVARPAASMLEVAGKTAQSIRNSSRPAQLRVSRVRHPRHLEPGSPLLPYSWNEAVGMSVLLEADNGRLKEEVYVMCQPLAEDGLYVVLTENLLLQVKWTGRDDHDQMWSIVSRNPVEDILYIDMERRESGATLEVLLCTPNLFRAKGSAAPSLAAAPSFASTSQQQQHKGVLTKGGLVVPSPFKSVSLRFSDSADEFHSALLHVLGRKQNTRLTLRMNNTTV